MLGTASFRSHACRGQVMRLGPIAGLLWLKSPFSMHPVSTAPEFRRRQRPLEWPLTHSLAFAAKLRLEASKVLASRPLELRYAMRALHLRIAKNRRFGDWRAPIAGSRAPSRRRLCRLRSKIGVERLFGRPTACIISIPARQGLRHVPLSGMTRGGAAR